MQRSAPGTHELVDGGVQPACLDGLEHRNGLQPTGGTQAVTNHGLRHGDGGTEEQRDREEQRKGGGARPKGE